MSRGKKTANEDIRKLLLHPTKKMQARRDCALQERWDWRPGTVKRCNSRRILVNALEFYADVLSYEEPQTVIEGRFILFI